MKPYQRPAIVFLVSSMRDMTPGEIMLELIRRPWLLLGLPPEEPVN